MFAPLFICFYENYCLPVPAFMSVPFAFINRYIYFPVSETDRFTSSAFDSNTNRRAELDVDISYLLEIGN